MLAESRNQLVVILLSVYQTCGIYLLLIKIMMILTLLNLLYTTCFMESLMNDALIFCFLLPYPDVTALLSQIQAVNNGVEILNEDQRAIYK